MARSARDGKGSWPQLAAFVVDGRTTTRRMFPPYELAGRSDEPEPSQPGDTTSTPASSVTYGIGRSACVPRSAAKLRVVRTPGAWQSSVERISVVSQPMLHASQSRVPARLPTVLLGAVTGLTSALILELTGHSAIAILSLLAASIVLSYLATINPPPDPLFRLYRFCHTRAAWSRSGIVLLLVGGFLVLDMALAHNPRDFGYASLLPAVLISGVFFGFGCGLLAVAIAVLGTDLLFGLSVSDFSIAEWKSLAVLATFTVLGALIGWAFWMLLSAYDDSITD